MTVSAAQVLPLYSQIKEQLLSAISHGEFAVGDQLPSQRELCERYGASHMTVRRAISDLISLGVISAIPGKGLYVADHKHVTDASPLISFTEDMNRRGVSTSSKLIDSYLTTAPTLLARTLGVDIGVELIYLYRLRLTDNRPLTLQSTYLVHSYCPNLLSYDLNQVSLYQVLREQYHITLTNYDATVESVIADEEEAELLGIPMPAALLVIEQVTYVEDRRALEYTRSAYRGDRYRLQLDIDGHLLR